MSSASSVTAVDVGLQHAARDVAHNDFYDESCALLSNQQPTVDSESQVSQMKATPVPKMQLFTLCLVRYAILNSTVPQTVAYAPT